MTIASSILDTIGETPMVDVSSLSPNPSVRLVAKLEGQNPGGSVKDRIALRMVTDAEADGTLEPWDPDCNGEVYALAVLDDNKPLHSSNAKRRTLRKRFAAAVSWTRW